MTDTPPEATGRHPEDSGDAVDRFLTDRHEHLLERAGQVLDVEAGLREILLARHHTTTQAGARDHLDVEAGLAAITGSHHQPEPVPAAALPARPATVGQDSPTVPSDLHPALRTLAALPAVDRLRHGTIGGLTPRYLDLLLNFNKTYVLAVDLAHAWALARIISHLLTRNRARALDRDLARALARDLDHARDHTRDLDLALGLGLDHARDLALALDNARTRARARAHLQALALALDNARTRTRDHARDLAGTRGVDYGLAIAHAVDHSQARARDRALDHVLDNSLDLDPDMADEFAHSVGKLVGQVRAALRPDGVPRGLWEVAEAVIALELPEASRVAEQARALLLDMRGEDLWSASAAGLRPEHLERVHWSATTQWPPGWADWVRVNSAELAPGVWVVGPGPATADDPVTSPA